MEIMQIVANGLVAESTVAAEKSTSSMYSLSSELYEEIDRLARARAELYRSVSELGTENRPEKLVVEHERVQKNKMVWRLQNDRRDE